MSTFSPKKPISETFYHDYATLTKEIKDVIQPLLKSPAKYGTSAYPNPIQPTVHPQVMPPEDEDTEYTYEDYLSDEQYELDELSYYEHDY